MKNQTPQPGSGAMFWRAIRFCGDAIGEAPPPMLAERAIPRRRALIIGESLGRLRRIGLKAVSKLTCHRWSGISYLNDGKAQHWCSYVTNPHTGEHGNEHAGKQNVSWPCTSLAQHKCSHHFGDIVL